jgi:hypothetical protein
VELPVLPEARMDIRSEIVSHKVPPLDSTIARSTAKDDGKLLCPRQQGMWACSFSVARASGEGIRQ